VSNRLKRYHPQIKAMAKWSRPVVDSHGFSDEAQPLFKPRMGWMKYLNTFPMRCAYADMFAANTGAYQGELIHHPSMLNQALACGLLDVSLVSTAAYFAHQNEWQVFPQLSIASHGPVNSVLWLRTPAFDASHHALCVPQASASSTALLRHLLVKQQACPATEVEYPPGTPWASLLESYQNVLLIGDAALRFYSEWMEQKELDAGNTRSFTVMDLATEWQQATGHPFVFGVWCAPKAYATTHEASIHALLSRLAEGTQYHLNHCDSLYERYMAERAASSNLNESQDPPFAKAVLLPYWQQNLSYTLEPEAFTVALAEMHQAFYATRPSE
jgi:predicted solute-binding protein